MEVTTLTPGKLAAAGLNGDNEIDIYVRSPTYYGVLLRPFQHSSPHALNINVSLMWLPE